MGFTIKVNRAQLLTSLNFRDTESAKDFVAAGMYIESGKPSHAVLVICHNCTTRILHFLGYVIIEQAEEVENDGTLVFIKELDFIPSFLVPSFLAHCELIQKEAKP